MSEIENKRNGAYNKNKAISWLIKRGIDSIILFG